MQDNKISGRTPINEILAATELIVQPGQFILAGIAPEMRPRLEAHLSAVKDGLFQYTVETDVLTLLVGTDDWSEISSDYPNAVVEGPPRIFTFSVVMD